MKVLNIFILMSLFVFPLTHAFKGNIAQARSAVCNETPVNVSRPLLYRLERDGKVIYLFGTHHSGVPLKAFSTWLYPLLNSADVIVKEAIAGTRQSESRSKESLWDAESPPTSDKISPEAWIKLREIFKRANIKEDWGIHLTPIGLIMVIGQDDPCRFKSGRLDQEIQDYGVARGKLIFPLDATQVFRDVASAVTYEDIDRLLLTNKFDSTDDVEVESHSSSPTLKAYLEGAFETFESYAKHYKASAPQFYELLLIQRNSSWVRKILKLHQNNQTLFVAVGALHLFGEDGLIRRLEKENFKVTRRPSEWNSPGTKVKAEAF